MAAISYNLKLNQNKVAKIERAQETALFKTADALKTDVILSQVMPFDTGTMQNESTFVHQSDDHRTAALITNTPYARRLYYHPEYNFQTINNPNARGLWLEDYVNGSKSDFCVKTFAVFLKGELK